MITNLKRKMGKKVLCVMLILTTVLANVDITVLAVERQTGTEANGGIPEDNSVTENPEGSDAVKEENPESGETEDVKPGSGETGSETGGEGSRESAPGEEKKPENPEGSENPENPDNPETPDDGMGEGTGEVGEDKPAEEPGTESGEIADTEQETGEEETEEIGSNATAAEGEDVEASGKCGDNLTWTLKDGTLTISGTGEMWDYELNNDRTTSPWNQYKMSRLVLSEGITRIGNNAFYHCYFNGELIIPESVRSIGDNAFYYAYYDGGIVTGDLIIPSGVKLIGEGAFFYCSAFKGNLTIANGVEKIGNSAFESCDFIGDLTIPESVTSIGASAFEWCDNFDGNLVISNGVKHIGEKAFRYCEKFKGDLEIPNSIPKIETDTFYNCGFTGELIIPNNVTSIGAGAFHGCNFIGDLVIPNSVIDIGRDAFYGNGFTGNLVIPSSITVVSGFSGCRGFTTLTLHEGVTEIDWGAFSGCSGFMGNLKIPRSVERIGGYAFAGCSGFTGELIIPESVTLIGDLAFSGCKGFTGKLKLPNNITYIADEAFKDCSGFTGDLIIPNGVVEIKEMAFMNCTGLSSVTIPASVTQIYCHNINEDGVFSGCIGLNNLYFKGDAPEIVGLYNFYKVNANIYYPAWKTGWENLVNRNYHGTLTWISYAEGEEPWNNNTDEINKPDNSPIELSHNAHIYVIDSDLGTPVAGALVNGTATDANGYIAMPVEEEGKEAYISVTADGYIPYMSYKALSTGGTYYISMAPSDGEFDIVYAKATIGNTVTNLLADKVYLQHTEDTISDASASAMMEIEVKARGDVKNYTLVQDGALIASSEEGKFSVPIFLRSEGNALTNLKAQKDVRIKATDVDGKTTVKRIGIYISPEGAADIKEENKSGSLKIGSNIEFTLPDNTIPFLGGETLSYGLANALPFDLTVERNGLVKIAINKGTSQSIEAFKEDFDGLSRRAQNLSDAAAAFGGKPEKFGAGCLSASVTVKGYGEGYIDMTRPGTFGVKVDVIVAGKGSAKYQQYFWAGAVPLYISVEAGAELSDKVTLSIKGEDFILQTEGGVGTLSGKIFLTAKAGVGVEKVVSVGVSGTGACNYFYKPLDDYTKVWLNAYLELEADCFGWHMNLFKSPEATHTIYESQGSSGGAMGGRSLTEGMTAQLYNADAYTVIDRSYLHQEAAAPITAFSASGSDTFVQSSVYPGADPKLVRAGDKFYLF